MHTITLKQSIAVIILTLSLGACRTNQDMHYSYNVERYAYDWKPGSEDTLSRLVDFSSILSYGNYLFEYVVVTHIHQEVHGSNKPIITITYDTSGVYLINSNNGQYFEFNNFSLQSSIIKSGAISDKPRGMNLSPVVKTDSSDVYYGPPQNLVINNIPCYLSKILSKKEMPEDSVSTKVILMKKPNLNSLYKIKGIEFTDKAYCVVGLWQTRINKNASYEEKIKNFRMLTREEMLICRNMVKQTLRN